MRFFWFTRLFPIHTVLVELITAFNILENISQGSQYCCCAKHSRISFSLLEFLILVLGYLLWKNYLNALGNLNSTLSLAKDQGLNLESFVIVQCLSVTSD